MATRTVIEGNTFYEIDEACVKRLRAELDEPEEKALRLQPEEQVRKNDSGNLEQKCASHTFAPAVTL